MACPISKEESLAVDRMGALHTEGLGDSWANIYLWIAQAIDAKKRGDEAFLKTHHYPGIEAGTEGVRWLENCVRSADGGSVWVDFKYESPGRAKDSKTHETFHLHRRDGRSLLHGHARQMREARRRGHRDDRRRLVPRRRISAPTGCWPTRACSRHKLKEIEARGLEIAALNCSANPLDPGAMGERHRKEMEQTIRLAGEIGVKTIVTMSGPSRRRTGRHGAELARLHQKLARRDARARPLPVGGLRLPALAGSGEARRRGRRREIRAREFLCHAGLEPRDPVPPAQRGRAEGRHEPRPEPPDVDGGGSDRLRPRLGQRDPPLPRQGHPHRARARRCEWPSGAEGGRPTSPTGRGTTSPSARATTCSGGRSSSRSCA